MLLFSTLDYLQAAPEAVYGLVCAAATPLPALLLLLVPDQVPPTARAVACALLALMWLAAVGEGYIRLNLTFLTPTPNPNPNPNPNPHPDPRRVHLLPPVHSNRQRVLLLLDRLGLRAEARGRGGLL